MACTTSLLPMRKAAPARTGCGLSHGQRPEVPPTKPLSFVMKFNDNAPRGQKPTSLLDHETSDHLLSRC